MAKARKSDSDDEVETPKATKRVPWAVEVEFFNKPSFMASVHEVSIDDEHISIVRDDGAVLAFPYDAVRKVLVMHIKETKHNTSD